MTIASEITRLQTAKSTARTSIINKWVSVPVEASVEDYHTYIDLIQQWDGGVLTWWLKLYNNLIDAKDGTPSIIDSVAWTEDGKYYGCCVASIEWTSANSLASYVYAYRKINTTSDMQYVLNKPTWDQSGDIYDIASNATFWRNSTNMKIIFFVDSTLSTNPISCYQAIWDFKNTGTITSEFMWRWTTKNYTDYGVSTAWYVQEIRSSWVKSVNGERTNQNAYIYLTLK